MAIDGLPRTIGLVTSSLDGDYSRRMVAGATEVLLGNGFSPLCFSPGASGANEYQIPRAFLDFVVKESLAGLIFAPSSLRNVQFSEVYGSAGVDAIPASSGYGTEEFLQGIGDLPVVCVGAWLSSVPSFWVQNGAGIRLVMKHLTEVCGRRRIAFIRGPENNVEAEARFRTWQDFCIEHSLPYDEELTGIGDFTPSTGEAAALRILETNAGELPDAFAVANDRMALGVLQALRTKGLTVPRDVSVVGFDDLEAESADPPLTTVRQPVFEIGQRAAEVLMCLLRSESVAMEHMFNPELIVRASCQPNQEATTFNEVPSGMGASVFLESAYPSAELLMPLLHKPPQDSPKSRRFPSPLGDLLVGGLASGLERAKVRERDLVASVRRMQAHVIEHLEKTASHVKSIGELHAVVLGHLHCLGLESLTMALLCEHPRFKGECRLVVNCTSADEAPPSMLGARLPGAQIIASHAERPGRFLRVAEPVYHDGNYCGILVGSGKLLDNPLLNQLGTVLARAAMRIHKETSPD